MASNAQLNSQVTSKINREEADKVNRAMKLMNEAKDETIADAKVQIQKTYDDTKKRIQKLQEKTMKTVEKSVESVENTIQENPMKTIFGALFAGLIFGFIFGRRRP